MNKIVIASSCHQLEDAFVSTASSARRSDVRLPTQLLVPSTRLGRRLTRLLAQQLGGLLHVHPLTPTQLSDLLLATTEQRRTTLHPALAISLAQHIIGIPGATGTDTSAAATAVVRDIGFCKQAMLTPNDCPSQTAGGFAEIWHRYEARLASAGLWDNEDHLRQAAACVGDSPWLQSFGALWIYGFTCFTPLLRQLIGGLCRHCDVTAFFACPQQPAYAPLRSTIDWLQAQGFASHQMPMLPPEPAVRVVAANHEYQEAQAVAEIAWQAAGQGLAWRDIAVVWRQAEKYRRYLPDILLAQRMPLHQTRSTLDSTAEGLLLLAVGELFVSGFARVQLMRLANNRALSSENILPPSQQPFFLPSAWHWLSAELNISQQTTAWQNCLGHFVHRQNAGADPSSSVSGGVYTANWPPLRMPAGGRAEDERRNFWGKTAEALQAFVCFWQDVETRCQQTQTFQGAVTALCANYVQVCKPSPVRDEIVQSILPLQQADALQLPWSMQTFWRLITMALSYAGTDAAGAPTDGVLVADIEEAIAWPRRYTIVVGMTQEEFTAAPVVDPWLDEQEKTAIVQRAREHGKELVAFTRRQQAEQDRWYLHLLLSGQSAVLLWPRKHLLTGHEQQMSSLLSEQLLANNVKVAEASLVCAQGVSTPVWRRDAQLAAMALANNDVVSLQCLARHNPLFATAALNFAAYMARPSFDHHSGCLRSPHILAEVRQWYSPVARPRINARMLETYAVCPFQYFLRYVVKVPTWKEESSMPSLSMSQQGQIVVDVLAKLANLPPPTAARQLREQLAKACANHPLRQMYPAMVWQIAENKIAENLEYQLDSLVVQDDGPPYCHIVYGESGSPAVSLQLDQQRRLLLCGHIDQIQTRQGGRPVTGRQYRLVRQLRPWRDDDVGGGEFLSLAVDLFALFHLFPGLAHDGEVRCENYDVCCHSLDDQGNVQQLWFHGHAWPRTGERLREVCRRIVHGIEEGIFCPLPAPVKCRLCPYVEACGPLRETVFQRKQDDPRLAFLLEMKEDE